MTCKRSPRSVGGIGRRVVLEKAALVVVALAFGIADGFDYSDGTGVSTCFTFQMAAPGSSPTLFRFKDALSMLTTAR
jgi:hypothetical protein